MPPNAIEPNVFRETLRNILTTASAAEQQQASSTTQVAVLTRIFIDECQSLLDSNTPLPTDGILEAAAHLHETSSAYQSHVTAGSDHRPHTPTSQTGVRSAQRSPRANKAQKDADRIDTTDVAWNDLLKAHALWQKSGHDTSSYSATAFLSIMKMHGATLLRSFPLLKEVRIDPTVAECRSEFSSHLSLLANLAPKLEPVAAICFLINCLCDSTITTPATPSSANESNLALADIERHFNSQIRRPFQGDAPQRFLRFAMRVNTELFQTSNLQSLPYFKGTPLVQSSGTGKTRMLLQLGNMAPLLYICARNTPADARKGYPLPDLQLRTFLDRPTEISMQEKLAVFLAAWFEILAQDLEKLTHAEAKFNYLGQLNQYGDTNIKQKRQTFFHRVLQLANTKAPNGKSPPNHQDIFETHLKPPLFELSKQLKQVQLHCRDKVNDMPHTPVPPVFVTVDECVDLPDDALPCLHRAWNYMMQLEQDHSHQMTCFWLVLLSTNSGASSLIEPIHYQYANGVVASLRHIGAHPLPTFVAIGFDLLCAERTSLDSAAQVASLNSIKLYGCPLWASLLPSEIDFWVTAKQKLLGADNYDGSIEQCFSVLASCLALRFVPIHSGSITLFGQQLSFLRNAVDHHMRMLTQVDPEGVLQVKSPSEPILAIAASFTMLPTPAKIAKDRQLSLELATKRYGSMLHTLNTLFLPSASIDLFRGTRGELMSCIAWMAAWDAIKLQELRQLDNQRAYNPATPSFSTDSNSNNIGLDSHARLLHQPVLLNKILVEMVQLDHAEQSKVDARIDKVCKMVSRCYDDAGTDIQAWTHFTHFDVLNNNLTQISPEFLWHCWKRGVALRMKSSQHGINGIIPVFIGNLDHKFSSQRQAGPAQSSSNDVNTDAPS
ncbi:hypothetical protein [Sporisorium scitamineum]|uniref:Uncharacterized protein n=1 Tax=Sporisorium scitamineum TaxID=49012 RepID=A0A0F7RX27_9BASI|nr:hypothetical protein [Sporisorium scitamineum]